YPYLRQHNVFVNFSDVANNSAQAAKVVPFTQFSTDLGAHQLPNYSMIVPNAEDDAHDCPGGGSVCDDNAKLAAADQWLRSTIAPFIASPAFQSSLLVIVFDESNLSDLTDGGGHVAMVVVSPKVKPGYQSASFFQHQSTLRLSMQALGVNNFPGAAAVAPSMNEFLK